MNEPAYLKALIEITLSQPMDQIHCIHELVDYINQHKEEAKAAWHFMQYGLNDSPPECLTIAFQSKLVPDQLKVFNTEEKPERRSCKTELRLIYVMRNSRNGLYKIGISRNPQYRENTLASQEPEIALLFSRIGTVQNEQWLHSFFSHKRKRGEWFELSENDVEFIRTTEFKAGLEAMRKAL